MRHDATVEHIVRAVAPGTEVDQGVLQSLLDDKPRPADVVPLVSSDIPAVVRAAVLYLGLYGTVRECPVLALCLHHSDLRVVELAERALWSIWMQSGGADGNERLASAVNALASDNHEAAIRTLSLLVLTRPEFAEAHFQLGLALSSADQPADAARSYREALRLNPYHFAAAAALGHVCVEQGNLPAALHFYEQSLRIHPRLADVPEAIRQVKALLPQYGH